LAIRDANPNVFHGIVRIPFCGEQSAILLDVTWSDKGVCVCEMLEHGKWRHIRKSEVEVFKDSEVAGVNGLNNHSFQF
jgi:hypothetical protein